MMSTSPRVAAKLLAAVAAATVGIGLAAAAPAAADRRPGGNFGSCCTSPTGPAAALVRQRVSPFERFENAFDRFFHIPDPDDNVRLAAPAN